MMNNDIFNNLPKSFEYLLLIVVNGCLLSKEFSSYSDLEALMEIFSDSSIEFSTYRIPVGNIKGRNTIIWEVRNY